MHRHFLPDSEAHTCCSGAATVWRCRDLKRIPTGGRSSAAAGTPCHEAEGPGANRDVGLRAGAPHAKPMARHEKTTATAHAVGGSALEVPQVHRPQKCCSMSIDSHCTTSRDCDSSRDGLVKGHKRPPILGTQTCFWHLTQPVSPTPRMPPIKGLNTEAGGGGGAKVCVPQLAQRKFVLQ